MDDLPRLIFGEQFRRRTPSWEQAIGPCGQMARFVARLAQEAKGAGGLIFSTSQMRHAGADLRPLLPPLGVAPAGEIAEREHQQTAQHHVIDHHQGVRGFHAICSP